MRLDLVGMGRELGMRQRRRQRDRVRKTKAGNSSHSPLHHPLVYSPLALTKPQIKAFLKKASWWIRYWMRLVVAGKGQWIHPRLRRLVRNHRQQKNPPQVPLLKNLQPRKHQPNNNDNNNHHHQSLVLIHPTPTLSSLLGINITQMILLYNFILLINTSLYSIPQQLLPPPITAHYW